MWLMTSIASVGVQMSKVIKLHEHERKRRSGERPRFIAEALEWRSNKRWGTHRFPNSNVTLKCHSKPWERVGDCVYNLPDHEQGWVKRQSRFGWIELDGEKVGALDATRYETETLIDTEEFVLIMDMDSALEAAFGVILGDAWQHIGMDVTDYGTIIHLSWAWTDPAFKVGIPVNDLFKQLLKPWLPSHAVIVLKAFPLEYEGYNGFEGEEGAEFDIAFRRRRRALVRMFETAGFQLFPGKAGNDGWMLRIPDRLRGSVTPPQSGQLEKAMCRYL
ncbi:MAG: hypothetical protein AAFO74_02260 [Pseudomonadota bacterium]